MPELAVAVEREGDGGCDGDQRDHRGPGDAERGEDGQEDERERESANEPARASGGRMGCERDVDPAASGSTARSSMGISSSEAPAPGWCRLTAADARGDRGRRGEAERPAKQRVADVRPADPVAIQVDDAAGQQPAGGRQPLALVAEGEVPVDEQRAGRRGNEDERHRRDS